MSTTYEVVVVYNQNHESDDILADLKESVEIRLADLFPISRGKSDVQLTSVTKV